MAAMPEECEQSVAEVTKQLDADPCDTAAFDRLVASLRALDKRGTAQTAAETYASRCASSNPGAAPAEPR